MPHQITPFIAAVLGVVEGLTEFLPVSSTGHLILASHWLGLDHGDEGLKAFEIVIQSGALLAVIGIYLSSIRSMLSGMAGRDPEGLRLLKQLVFAFLPAAVLGVLFDKMIEAYLFGIKPVILALALGGVWMLLVEHRRIRQAGGKSEAENMGLGLDSMTLGYALIIGCAQCLAMWPGTSRSMMTIMTAMILGFKPRAAAEFSFLLALPTLGGATVYKIIGSGDAILASGGVSGLLIGTLTSCIVAWLAVKTFLGYLRKYGMGLFGWYRIILAGMVLLIL
jgi:undecaprenyl-diphosphatase